MIEDKDIEKINYDLEAILRKAEGDPPFFSSEPKNNRSDKPILCVIGLGYVGFPLAVIAASKGYEVYGYDLDKKKLNRIEKGENLYNEKFLEDIVPKVKIKTFTDQRLMRLMDIFVIAVPTPVDEKYYPILDPVIDASQAVAENMKAGSLVILESTVNPGVCEEVVWPIFEKAGWQVGKDVYIAHCPERVNPGDIKWNVTNIPRVIGSFENEGLQKAKNFYESIIDAPIYTMKSIREAEAVKIMENSFRDVNIAFVNELAKSFARMKIDIVDVIRGASTKPFSFMPHWPSCGVGGHCIPVDPYYLIEKAKDYEFDHKFLRTARNINNSMPSYTVEILIEALNEIEKAVKNTTIGILGVSYKANVADLRESPSLKIISKLEKLGAKINIYDPYVPNKSTVSSIFELFEKSEALLLATDHDLFTKTEPEQYAKYGIKVIIDGKNCLDKDKIQKLGIIYRGIGR